MDFCITHEGTVARVELHSDAAKDFARAEMSVEGWQWLGSDCFAVDHRVARWLAEDLRGLDFEVLVQ